MFRAARAPRGVLAGEALLAVLVPVLGARRTFGGERDTVVPVKPGRSILVLLSGPRLYSAGVGRARIDGRCQPTAPEPGGKASKARILSSAARAAPRPSRRPLELGDRLPRRPRASSPRNRRRRAGGSVRRQAVKIRLARPTQLGAGRGCGTSCHGRQGGPSSGSWSARRIYLKSARLVGELRALPV